MTIGSVITRRPRRRKGEPDQEAVQRIGNRWELSPDLNPPEDDYSPNELAVRAIRNAHYKRSLAPNWVHVRDAFGIGRT
ncbi:MAG: hypothetical protein LBV36_06010 [Chromatiales bacterium]|jgi:hypothetical protein|nr:hypothetical protein [Chromatiales bacterium]